MYYIQRRNNSALFLDDHCFSDAYALHSISCRGYEPGRTIFSTRSASWRIISVFLVIVLRFSFCLSSPPFNFCRSLVLVPPWHAARHSRTDQVSRYLTRTMFLLPNTHPSLSLSLPSIVSHRFPTQCYSHVDSCLYGGFCPSRPSDGSLCPHSPVSSRHASLFGHSRGATHAPNGSRSADSY